MKQDILITCQHCRQTVRRRAAPGRRPDYCSLACRRQAEFAERRRVRSFEALKLGFTELGEAETRRKVADDPEFAVQLLEMAEAFLSPPDGRELPSVAPETWQFLLTPRRERRFMVISHDNPLPSSADIDEAEATGNWKPMIKAALASMTWQIAHEFKPDMRGLGVVYP